MTLAGRRILLHLMHRLLCTPRCIHLQLFCVFLWGKYSCLFCVRCRLDIFVDGQGGGLFFLTMEVCRFFRQAVAFFLERKRSVSFFDMQRKISFSSEHARANRLRELLDFCLAYSGHVQECASLARRQGVRRCIVVQARRQGQGLQHHQGRDEP